MKYAEIKSTRMPEGGGTPPVREVDMGSREAPSPCDVPKGRLIGTMIDPEYEKLIRPVRHLAGQLRLPGTITHDKRGYVYKEHDTGVERAIGKSKPEAAESLSRIADKLEKEKKAVMGWWG